ncbi:uncharacterized protein BDR25DRAFT_385302 [Lindgomyces ingoldianus]|uniref:Uncharacterized protein n=1 Tax=Lindgomyces ingoldianus TaxID=673940 RepID=A0ACB6Q987_9PLEO|nr:uncharacterized protein BDR25DRAFT_385302 [Lindgomyces ingoldianus]KAF2462927.1 hypothetical protein BDR25DRAFT_385302 [Lindgomyces ingoldianus]
MRAIRERQKRRHVYTKFPSIDQQLKAQRTHSFCWPGNNPYLTNLKRGRTTKRSKAQKHPKRARAPSPNELPATNNAAAEGRVSTSKAESPSAALEPSRPGSESQADGEGAKETESRSLKMQQGSPQPTEEYLQEASGTKPEAIADVRRTCAAEAPRDQEHSPAEVVLPVEAVEAVKTQAKAGLDEDMQLSRNRAISEDSEAIEAATPQTDTEAMSREPGTSENNPITIPEDDSDKGMDTEDMDTKDMDTKDEDKVDEPSDNMIINNKGQPITNNNVSDDDEESGKPPRNMVAEGQCYQLSSFRNEYQPTTDHGGFEEDMDAEGSEEDMDAEGPEEDVDAEGSEEDMDAAGGEQPITNNDGSDKNMGIKDGDEANNAINVESNSDPRRRRPRQRLPGMVNWTSRN